ncbi:DEAD-box ATP-dependent RNA helicase [Ceratobasidium sp. 392]|nr:DEAD-box ATP-dependent RNA helicase [Ceratobasidium sp. 392]
MLVQDSREYYCFDKVEPYLQYFKPNVGWPFRPDYVDNEAAAGERLLIDQAWERHRAKLYRDLKLAQSEENLEVTTIRKLEEKRFDGFNIKKIAIRNTTNNALPSYAQATAIEISDGEDSDDEASISTAMTAGRSPTPPLTTEVLTRPRSHSISLGSSTHPSQALPLASHRSSHGLNVQPEPGSYSSDEEERARQALVKRPRVNARREILDPLVIVPEDPIFAPTLRKATALTRTRSGTATLKPILNVRISTRYILSLFKLGAPGAAALESADFLRDHPPLDPVPLDNIQSARYATLTPAQKYCVPVVVAGRDLMACARTSSGKTAGGGFLFPILSASFAAHVHPRPSNPNANYRRHRAYPAALIPAPTRELVSQIHDETRKFAYRS